VYCSKFTDEAVENIKRLPKNVKNALKKEFEKKIHVDPIGCSEPLTGLLEGFRSFHFEDYGIVYNVIEDIRAVAVVAIGKKDKAQQTDLYRRLEALAKTGKLAKAVLETYRSIAP
jgi:mRNA-degrading endonuclease RelE of RelBE toxin-antitoxin system